MSSKMNSSIELVTRDVTPMLFENLYGNPHTTNNDDGYHEGTGFTRKADKKT